MIKVYTGGTFDLFHAGHVNFLKEARRLGDHLTVAVNDDAFVTQFKRTPVCNFQERIACIESCKYVDAAIKNFGGQNSGITIKLVAPQIIAIGDDWQDKDYLGQLGITQKFLDHHGIEIKYIPYTKNISSTEIISRIFKRAMSTNV